MDALDTGELCRYCSVFPEGEKELRAADGFGQFAIASDHILFFACGQVSCCIKK